MGHRAYWTRHILNSMQIDSQPVDLTLPCCSNTKQTQWRCLQSLSLQFIAKLNGFPLLRVKASNSSRHWSNRLFSRRGFIQSSTRTSVKDNAEADQICIFTPSSRDAEQAVRHWAGIERLKPEERGLFIESIQIRHSLVLSLDFSSAFSAACFCAFLVRLDGCQ